MENNVEDEKALEYSDNGGFLWKVEHGDTEMYLQGTIHLGEEDVFPLNKYAEKAFDEADIVVSEVDPRETDAKAFEDLVVSYGMYDEGKTLGDDVDEETLNKLEEIVTDAGLQFKDVEHLKPWYVDMLIEEISLENSGVDKKYSIDNYFLDRAIEDNKEIIGLETSEFQIQVLSELSEDHQIHALESKINHYDELGNRNNEMFELWKNGDIDGLLESVQPANEVEEEYTEKVIIERNIDMAKGLKDLLEEAGGETYFVLIGASHYISEGSILSILEDEYEIEHIY